MRFKYNRNGSGTYNIDKEWYNGTPIKSIRSLVDEYSEIFSKKRNVNTTKTAFFSLLQDVENAKQFTALRIAVLQKLDSLEDSDAAHEFDKKIEQEIVNNDKFKVQVVGQEREEKEQQKGEKRKREEEEQEESSKKRIEDKEMGIVQKDDAEETKEMDIEQKESNKRKPDDDLDDKQEEETENPPLEKETENLPLEKETENPPLEKETENPPLEKETENPPEKEILPEIELTHPDEIQEKTLVEVHDPVSEIQQDSPGLPDSVPPEGQDNPTPSTTIIAPTEFNKQQEEIVQQQQQENLEQEKSFDDINDDYEDDLIEEDEESPQSYLGFDNDEKSIIVDSMPTPNELQDIYNYCIQEMIDKQFHGIDDIIQHNEMVAQEYKEEEEEETKEMDDFSTVPQPTETQDDEMQDEEMENVEKEEKEIEMVEMKEPSKSDIREQTNQRKKQTIQDQKRIKQEKTRQENTDRLHNEIFGQQSEPMMTDEYEKQQYNNSTRAQRVENYLNAIVAKEFADLMNQKKSYIGFIRQGRVLTEFYRKASDNPKSSIQQNIANETKNQSVKDRIREYINKKLLLQNSDIIAEVADFTTKNLEKIKARLDPKFAISKYIYPSFRDPDTFNIVKYMTDPNGNVIINQNTGQPIIASISAVERDDTRKLLEQRQAVDATDTPSPYFPIYGKQARRFFSKLEYNYLGRMFQGPGGKPRPSIPRPNDIKSRVQQLLNEMGSSLEMSSPQVEHKKIFKQWVELEVLKNSYQRYNQYADYNYNQDKKELGQDGTLIDPDATESAAKLLQNITVQKLLDLLSSQKKAELDAGKASINEDDPANINASLKDKQQTEMTQQDAAPDDMQVEKEPESVGAEIPNEANLNAWALKSQSSFNVFGQMENKKMYKKEIFPAFGGSTEEETKTQTMSAWV